MKTIRLEIEDDVYRQLQTGMGLRIMTGNSGGIVDAFVSAVVKAIDEGLEVKRLEFKPREPRK